MPSAAKYLVDFRQASIWGDVPVAAYGGGANFEHHDWLGTDRMVTLYNGQVEGSYASLPFGDGYTATGEQSYASNQFAGMDYDSTSGTYHAQYRQYSPTAGRWMSPDMYSGSYDPSNPQSFNRYSYVLNNPLALTDTEGLQGCDGGNNPDAPISGEEGCGENFIEAIVNFFEGLFPPGFQGSLKPRPNTDPWSENSGITYGPDIAGALGLPDPGCDFGVCDGGVNGLGPGSSGLPASFCSRYANVCAWIANELAYIKTHPVTGSVNEGIAGQIIYQGSTKTICASLGLGASYPPTKAVTVGILNSGDMGHWEKAVSGWGYSFGASLILGYQGIFSVDGKDGRVGGPIISGPGLSGSYAYGGCTRLP